jgi:signal transduction histidine kinase
MLLFSECCPYAFTKPEPGLRLLPQKLYFRIAEVDWEPASCRWLEIDLDVIAKRNPRFGSFIALLVLVACCRQIPANPPQATASVLDLPVTNGLIRWWPNLFDARDEITGQEGVVMGILPSVQADGEDETEFGPRARWVQLQPAVTNEVFTFTFWVRCGRNQLYFHPRLLGQESGEGEWFFQGSLGRWEFAIGSEDIHETDWGERVSLRAEVWQHVGIARRADGTSLVWVDGTRELEGKAAHPWPATSRWLCVGNGLKGDEPFSGSVRDLCAFDRVLTDDEVRAFAATGRPPRPPRNTPARLAATGRLARVEVSTNMVVASPQALVHRRFTTEDGLPGNIVKAALQARNGYLWVGTEEGLARFDGRHFEAFTAENTPALKAIGQTVWSLAEDTDGTIWAGIFGGLLRIRGLEFKVFTNGLPQLFVLQAEPAGDGSVWVAGYKTSVPRGPCRLRRYDPDSGRSSAEVVVPGQVRRLVVGSSGVWLGTEWPQQMLFWDGHSSATSVVGTVDDQAVKVRLATNRVVPLDRPLRAWRVGANGTNYWAEVNLGSNAPVFYWLWDTQRSHPWTGRWTGPAAAEAWLGVTHDLARLWGNQLEVIETTEHPLGPEITCLCAGREGGGWFGTEEDGLHFVKERLVRVYTTSDGLSGNDVRAVCATPDGGLWVATAAGANRRRDGVWTSFAQGKAAYRSVASDAQGDAWLGDAVFGSMALQKERVGRRTFVLLGVDWQDPNTLRFARDGTLWVLCERGLTWVKPDGLRLDSAETLVPDPASASPVYGRYTIGKELPAVRPLGLLEDRDGSMWIGSLEGGLLHLTNGRVEHFTCRDGLPGNRCVPVHLDDSGALWIVTEGGLCRRQAGRFQSISAKEGVPKDILLDLIEDGLGNFWISGKRGIHRIARRELEEFFAGRVNHVRSLTLGMRDGLLTPECSGLHQPTMARTPDGHIWVATLNGLATFDPSRVRLDTQPLQTIIERVVVNGQDSGGLLNQAGPGPMKLAPGSGQQLEFHYTAISLLGADRLRFRHRLEGYDSEWSPETDLRLAFYTNLKPGKYQFRVKAANAHGIWSEQETMLSFTILPYFWQTRLFYFSLAAAALLLAAGLHGWRLNEQARVKEIKHQQALISEKARIAADMHDELGAALTQIAVLGEVAKSQTAKEAATRPLLDHISQAARDVTTRMSDLVWATNPKNDTLDNLVAYLREQAASQLLDTALETRLEFPSHLPECRVSATLRRNLLLITKEALQNVLKHAAASAVYVHLELTKAESAIVLRIQDNGRSFDPSAANGTGNGLGNMEKRVRDLAGQFSVKSAPGQGTCLEFRLPLDPVNGPAAKL